MAVFAGLVPSEYRLPGGDLGEGIAAIVSVLTEALRNEISADGDEDENAYYENDGKPQQVLRILEFCHPNSLGRKMNGAYGSALISGIGHKAR
jgi:hypothetical protein